MQEETSEAPSVEERLRNLASEHFGWKPRGLMGYHMAPFDISRPNIHDSKREFLFERDRVQKIIEHLDGIITLSSEPEDDLREEHSQFVDRLQPAIDEHAKRGHYNQPQTATSLAIQNVIISGFYLSSLIVVKWMKSFYYQRLEDLNAQEEKYWNVKNRPPNHYARTIALRFARFYAQQTGIKPTYGTSRDGPHPSTEYGRLLEEVFSILGITANIRGPAEYAISEITDADLGTEDSRELSKFLQKGEFIFGTEEDRIRARKFKNELDEVTRRVRQETLEKFPDLSSFLNQK